MLFFLVFEIYVSIVSANYTDFMSLHLKENVPDIFLIISLGR